MATNYERGRSFEYSVMKKLEKAGYVTVRAAGSKGPADIVAASRCVLLFVQCKISGVLPPEEWNTFMDFCTEAGAYPVMAMKNGRKIEFYLLHDKKDGTKKRQPMAKMYLSVLK